MARRGGEDDGRRILSSSGIFFAEGAKSRLMESTAVGRGRIRPKREEEEDRFPALISLRAGFSPRSLFYFSHYKAPHLRRARGKSRGIRRPLDLTGEEEKYSNRPELATERETIG